MNPHEKPGAIWLRNNPRLGGFIISTASFAFLAWADQQIIAHAKIGVKSVSIHMGYLLIAIFGFIGLAAFIGGKPVVALLQNFGQQKKDIKYYLIIFALFLPALIAFIWLYLRLSKLGYSF
jgi:hypothetical protein